MNAHTEHQVIRVVEVIEAIANMEVHPPHEGYLQRQDLVESLQSATACIDEVMPYSEVDGEIGHDELHAP